MSALFHTFPRPKKNENHAQTLERGLRILNGMKTDGLVLAPEVMSWDVSLATNNPEPLEIMQRRMCFTELPRQELPDHMSTFGPISLRFDGGRLRSAGAAPAIYVPQVMSESVMSWIGVFCVNGAYHLKGLLNSIAELETLEQRILSENPGLTIDPNCMVTLTNPNPNGEIAQQAQVKLSDITAILNYLQFRNIPWSHSVSTLSYFLELFCPTDNLHSGELLGYYRQREWRLTAREINFHNLPAYLPLTSMQRNRLEQIDPDFWGREIKLGDKTQKRSLWAVVYKPEPDWDFFSFVDAIVAPKDAENAIRRIVGGTVRIEAI